MDNIRSVAASRCYSTVRNCLVERLNNSRYTCETIEKIMVTSKRKFERRTIRGNGKILQKAERHSIRTTIK